MSHDSRLRSFHFDQYRQLWVLGLGFILLMHAASFWKPHLEGDEVVYLTLARDMNWDLSHYTTCDDPTVRTFPCSIYRSSLFHHPPLFPLILKFGYLICGRPIIFGLLFENAAMGLLLYYAWRWMVFQQLPVVWGAIAFAGITFCPLLLSSSVLLHHDALMGGFMACGLVAYVEALQRPTVTRAFIAGALLTIGFNLRYNALIFLPVLVVLQIDQIFRSRYDKPDSQTKTADAAPSQNHRWLVFGIVMTMVMTIGLQHYYRVLATYGSLMPSSFLQMTAKEAEFSPYLRTVMERKPWKTALHLVLIYPILLAFLCPPVYRPLLKSLRSGSRDAVFIPIFLGLFAAEFYFSYSQTRYFATVTPCLFLGLPIMIRLQSPRTRTILIGLAAISLMLMFATGFAKTQASAPDSMAIIPAPCYYIPPLRAIMY